ncbi:MAG: aldehyde dehydrogenase family protein [Candidatus Krumholzibacteriota bacterium]|nr:aldehyde dehydrogenase family protein [Candidatus Krumholzibacteriota bacterium]
MLEERYPYYLAGEAVQANADLAVHDKYTGEVATRVALADEAAIDAAIGAAAAAAPAMAALPAHARAAALSQCARTFAERAEELAQILCVEVGKPIGEARGEVGRLVDTFTIAAEEALRIGGEILPLDRTPRAAGTLCLTRRVPVGPVSCIVPFNYPLNLAAHKAAPAIAAGCPFVLKPASLAPVGSLLIGEVLARCDLPVGAFSILPCRREGAGLFSGDPRLKLLTFTGSPDAGWALKARAGKMKVVLELGGNAACIVDADADLDAAAARITLGAFGQSGQSCISVQRIFVHADVYESLSAKLVAAARALKVGDPKAEDTFVGPLITEAAARRVAEWIAAARARGATLLTGGGREGALVEPTLLADVPADEPISCKEAFGPVAVLSPFADFDAVLDAVNDSRYGLQAGLFVRDIAKIRRAWDRLEVGGVVIGDVPSWRADVMPYGGVKDSGLGREGVRWAIEDMTELRSLILRP